MTFRRRSASGERMSLAEHLLELRNRLGFIVLAVLTGAIGGWFFADMVWAALSEPVQQLAVIRNREALINYTSVTEAFDTKIAISFVLGIVASSPVWLYQLWAYFVPALYRREKKYALGFLLVAIPFFIGGVSLGWTVLPNIVSLLTSFAPEQTATLLTARVYLDFSLKLILAVGVGFILPVFLVLLNVIGVLSANSIIRGWRIAIVVISIFAALATPAADVISMLILAVPLTALYFLAYGISWLHDHRQRKKMLKAENNSAKS